MPQYKLTYFNGRGRAELIRLILHYVGADFEDFRMEREQWPSIKPTTPFGQVPVFEVDGKMLAQSNAIARYLARKHGIAGKDEWEQAQADMYVDCIIDLMHAGRPLYQEKDTEKQKELMATFVTEHVAPLLARIESHLEKNNGVLVGNEITWADIACYTFFSFAGERFGDVMKNCPHLKELIVRIESHDHIKKYLETRPVTAM